MTTLTTEQVGHLRKEATAMEIEGFRGQLITADHANYDTARALWNGAIDRRPRLVARCGGAADVVAAVRFAARVQELGLGRCLHTGTPTPEELRTAVEQLSVDPTIRARLAAMRRALDAAGGAKTGADAIERYLRVTAEPGSGRGGQAG